MKTSIRYKIEKFLNNKKLDQKFTIFKKVNSEFQSLEDCNFPSHKERVPYLKQRVKSNGKTETTKVLQVGFDTEYQQYNEYKNDIISYQLYFPAYHLGVIFYNNPKTYKRFSLEDFLQMLNEVFNHNNYFDEIDVISHFSVAEINSFENYKEFIKENNFEKNLQMVQKSFATTTPIHYKYTSSANHKKNIKINISDTWLMSGKESLKEITASSNFNIKKIELQKNQIENMKTLLKTNKELFDQYSIIDAFLTVEYNNQFYKTLASEFNITDRILTASSISAKVFQKRFGEETDELLGQYPVPLRKILPDGRIQNITVKKFKSGISHLRDSYYGGRNETFCSGISRNQEWGDYDLKSAYPTALLILQDIDWNNKVGITNKSLKYLSFNDLGIVTLKFKFKDSVMMPGFPIKDEATGGLVFVKEGEATIPLQELYMCLKNDFLDMKKTEIITGYKFLRKSTHKISTLVTEMIQKRNTFSKEQLENKFYKLINNSLYGKFTQGVEEKNLLDFFNSAPDEGDFNYSDLEYHKQRQSPIYNPGIASFITSTVRALVTEQMNYIEKMGWAKVISVTTDGYMLNVKLTEEQINELNKLPFTSEVESVRNLLLGEKGVLELKHYSSENTQNISVKTRCYWMNDEKAKATNQMSKILISRGGAQSQGSKEKDMDYMTRLLATACNDTEIDIYHMTNSIDMLSGTDLVRKKSKRSFNMDYDFKRCPNLETATNEQITYKDEEGNLKNSERITFNTLPFETFQEYQQIKQNYITYLSTTKKAKAINKVRTVEEMDSFLEYNQLKKLDIKVFKNQDNVLKYIVKSYLLYYIIKNNLKVTELNVANIAKMLNLNTKQIHNVLRNKIFKTYVLDFNCIARLDDITYEKYKEQIEYLLDGLDLVLRSEFLEFIRTPIIKEKLVEKPFIKILKNEFNNEPIDVEVIDNEIEDEFIDFDLNIDDIEEFLTN